MRTTLKKAVSKLSETYGFAREDGEDILGLNEKSETSKPKINLPWTGVANSKWCRGIRFGCGLYGQCTNTRPVDGSYCRTCAKKEDKPTVDNREEWISSKPGRKAKRYCSYMKKNGLSRADVETEALRFGLTIPDYEYEEEVCTKGRPRKTAAASDTDTDDEERKKRGRPRNKSESLDMFASLVAEHACYDDEEDPEWLPDTTGISQRAHAPVKETEAVEEETEAVKEEKAKLKAEKEAAKEEKAKLKAEKEAAKVEKAKLKAEKEAEKVEKAKLKTERENERELRRNSQIAKKAAKAAKEAEVQAPDEENEECPQLVEITTLTDKKNGLAALFGETESGGELEEEEYGTEADVKSWEHGGVKYLLNEKTGDVYDGKTQEHLGIWNGSEIEEVESDSE